MCLFSGGGNGFHFVLLVIVLLYVYKERENCSRFVTAFFSLVLSELPRYRTTKNGPPDVLHKVARTSFSTVTGMSGVHFSFLLFTLL